MSKKHFIAPVEAEPPLPPGFVPCSVEYECSAWLVTFDDGRSLLLQTDYDQAAFAVSCGAINAPDDWDGSPSKLDEEWSYFDGTTITACPDDYLDVAEGGAE